MDVFSHPWLSGLFVDAEIETLWSAQTQLEHMLAFETAWSRAGHLAGFWPESEGEAAAKAIAASQITPAALAAGTARDGVCVPDLVRILKAETGLSALHKGATSQDVIDTATALSMAATVDLLSARLEALDVALSQLIASHGHAALMGRTRMQAALTITVRDRLETWRKPLATHQTRLAQLRPRIAIVQIGGAAGDRAAMGDGADTMVASIAAALGLAASDHSWHAMRDGVGEFASCLSLITGTLGKMGQDICLMAQQGIDEITLSGGGGSSAMPHKQNPVLAELLVTLARFNAVQLSGMHQALIHEQERSGAAWALEWMILPQMAQATGRGLNAAVGLTASVIGMGDAAKEP
ncbi:MAG: 3-carboxy-cis,cis-muconate cycloisomerase [Yoonia sp.]|nr:3-carboxy-cis,cis-muconate cycloisomerase [Yoonia sp.]